MQTCLDRFISQKNIMDLKSAVFLGRLMMRVSLKIGRFQFSGETVFIKENLISKTILVFFSAIPQVGCFSENLASRTSSSYSFCF